jgi:activator of 2-hydroxyglutaryl-CoA dehydratase
VFAESEIISRKNSGADSADILAGVFASVAARSATLFNQIYARDKIALVGGGARFEAFRILFEKQVSRKTTDLPLDPQILSAYGAALCAGEG